MIFIDFEASAAMGGHPIEVGICHVNADRSLTSAGKLIRHDEWLDEFQRWDWQAEQIHHISRANLMEHGESPAVVMAWLNDQLRGQVACADSQYDLIWCQELAAAAGIAMEFAIMDIGKAFEGTEIAARRPPTEAKTHRAAADAEHLASWYVASLGDDAQVHRLLLMADGRYLRVPLERIL